MRATQLAVVLKQLVQAKENVLLVSSPGLGKTSIVHQVVSELKWDLIEMHPVVSDPTDFKGLPGLRMTEQGTQEAQFFPIGDLQRLIDATRKTVCFIDDAGQAPPAVQAAAMQLVWGGKINGCKISPHVTFVLATNRRQDKAAVTGLITPLLDRMTAVIELEFHLEDYIDWMLRHDMPADLAAFVRWKPDTMNKFDANRDMKKSPTPRSVAGLGRLINLGLDDAEVVQGAVGQGFGIEYLAYRRMYLELPDRDKVYANPDKIAIPTKLDVLYALMSSLAYGATAETITPMCKFLTRVQPEYAVLCMRDALRRNAALVRTKAFAKFCTDHKEAFGYDK